MTLEISGLKAANDAFTLGPIDLTVDEEILSVLGPSGCGKTTLLSLVAGILDADAGTVHLNGTDLTGLPPEDRGTAYVFQDGALFPHMTVRENVTYAADSAAVVDELTETLAVADLMDRTVGTLSGGERQRVALARALAARPDALLLDEPLANLDAPIKRRLRFELRDFLSQLDIPVVYVTHDQRQATTMGDRIAVMRDGTVRQAGTAEEIFERPATRFVAEFTGSVNLFTADVVERNDDGLTLGWGDTVLDAPAYGVESDTVWFCIRPEYVMLLREDRPVDERDNVLRGRIRRRVYQGDDYVVEFQPDAVADPIEIRLPTPVYERLSLDDRDRVRVSLKKRAIHVVDDARVRSE
ncbi:ABC transporter ATP-binding protein [Haloarculaceae archaeon H-GB11]|nr:ABC transporter ATP-binding protein [Haloarculaceae archaeon H-GB11]